MYYYLAHLVLRCGIKRDDMLAALDSASNEACIYQRQTRRLTDNQCIMVSNRWFYRLTRSGRIDSDGEMHTFDVDALNWWIEGG
jgi:hypothetical protein